MKRIIIALAALAICATSADAQIFSKIVGALTGSKTEATEAATTTDASSAVSSIVNMATAILGSKTSTNFDLTGTWGYNGSAVSITSSNTLTQVAAAASQTTIQNTVDTYLAKIGIKAGAMKFTFLADGNFTCTVGAKTLSGTYTYDKTTSAVTLIFGKTMKYLQMDGILKTSVGGCQLLFTSEKFVAFVKNIVSVLATKSTSSTISAVKSVLDSTDGLYIGFNLAK